MKKALLVGINYTGTKFRLNGCINDVISVRKMLVDNMGFLKQNIVIMTDNHKGNLKPTYSNILIQIDKLVQNLDTHDIVYFHYSGHGTQIIDMNGDEKDGMDECLVPLDYYNKNFILDDQLRERLVNKIPRGAYLIGVLDCCNSGSGFDMRFVVKQITKEEVERINMDEFSSVYKFLKHILISGRYRKRVVTTFFLELDETKKTTEGTIIMLSGCSENQTALDVNDGLVSGGALTLAFIKSMEETNYSPSCSELLKLVRNKVKNDYKSTQVPQLSFGRSSNIDKKIIFN